MQATRTGSTYRLILVTWLITMIALLGLLWGLMEVVNQLGVLTKSLDDRVICLIGTKDIYEDQNGQLSEIPLESSTAQPFKPGSPGSESLEMYRRDKNPS